MSIWHFKSFFQMDPPHLVWRRPSKTAATSTLSQSFSWGSPELSPHDFKQKCVSTNVSTVFPNWSSMLPCIYVNLSLLYLLENDPLYPDPTSNILVFPLVHPSIGDRAAISSMKWASPGHNRSIFFNRSEGLLCGKKPHNSSQGGAGSNRHVYLQNLTAWCEIKLSSCFTTGEDMFVFKRWSINKAARNHPFALKLILDHWAVAKSTSPE